MDTKPTLQNFLIVILPAILVVFVIFFLVMPKVQENREEKEQKIGGQRDEYDCLGPAGYTWSEEASACIRKWEIKREGSKQAIKIAVNNIG